VNAQAAQKNQPAFAVKIEVSETAIKPGAPLKLNIQTTNISPADISVKHASSDFRIEVNDDKSALVPRRQASRPADKMGVAWGHRVTLLKPGESFIHELNLQEIFVNRSCAP
jgi:hypothetical protein